MKRLLLLAVLLYASALSGEQNIRTVESRRADAKALYAEMHGPEAANVSYFVSSLHAEEMSRCQDIDPAIGTLESVRTARRS